VAGAAPHGAMAAMAGGGTKFTGPGEAALAHDGVLFLDQAPEYARLVLTGLRQPLTHGHVTVAHRRGCFPHRRAPSHFRSAAPGLLQGRLQMPLAQGLRIARGRQAGQILADDDVTSLGGARCGCSGSCEAIAALPVRRRTRASGKPCKQDQRPGARRRGNNLSI
jgi:Magnesium chelatase, subunit ChlI